MKRLILLLAAAALAAPATAAAKGPSAASIDGPGDGGGISIGGSGSGDPPAGTALGKLAMWAGFFPAMFGQEPDPMLPRRPKGPLGPRYTITYTVPGPDLELSKIRQDVYPYARGGAVTYMAPRQRFWDTQRTRGGWYLGGAELRHTLVAAGLPRTPPTSNGGSWFSATNAVMWTSLVALVLAAAAAIRLLRGRTRPATA